MRSHILEDITSFKDATEVTNLDYVDMHWKNVQFVKLLFEHSMLRNMTPMDIMPIVKADQENWLQVIHPDSVSNLGGLVESHL